VANQNQSIGALFSSDQLYQKLSGRAPTGTSPLTLSLATPAGFGFNPADNGSLQWLNPALSQPEWAEVVTTTPIPVANNVQLRFRKKLEQAQ
jgi:hypothetical protein